MFARGCGFAACSRIWTRMLAMVRRFQKATAVAPKSAEPAIRNAVDHLPRVDTGSIGATAAICSRSCISCFRDSLIIFFVSQPAVGGLVFLPSMAHPSIFSAIYLRISQKTWILAQGTADLGSSATPISMDFGRRNRKNI